MALARFFTIPPEQPDASAAQLLNSSYPCFCPDPDPARAAQNLAHEPSAGVFVALFGIPDYWRPDRDNTWLGIGLDDWKRHVVRRNCCYEPQRILYEMPAQVTLYVMSAMVPVVLIFRLFYGIFNPSYSLLSMTRCWHWAPFNRHNGAVSAVFILWH